GTTHRRQGFHRDALLASFCGGNGARRRGHQTATSRAAAALSAIFDDDDGVVAEELGRGGPCRWPSRRNPRGVLLSRRARLHRSNRAACSRRADWLERQAAAYSVLGAWLAEEGDPPRRSLSMASGAHGGRSHGRARRR